MDLTETFTQLVAALPVSLSGDDKSKPRTDRSPDKLRSRQNKQTIFSKNQPDPAIERIQSVHRRTADVLHAVSQQIQLLTKHGPAYVAAFDESGTFNYDSFADDDDESKYLAVLQNEPTLRGALKSRQSLRSLSADEKQSVDMQVHHTITSINAYLTAIKTEIDSADDDNYSESKKQLQGHLRGLVALVEHKNSKVRSCMRELHRRNGLAKTDALAITRLDANLPYWQRHQNDYYDDFADDRDAGTTHLFAQFQKFNPSSSGQQPPAANTLQKRAAARSEERRGYTNMSENQSAVLQDEFLQNPTAASFTREEIETYENQAQQIFRSVTGMREELSQLSGKVHHVASLQQLFAENVFEQEQTAELIAEHVNITSDNITDANVELMHALRKTTSFRYWITFILLVLSLTLVFLDWYNP